MADGVRDREEIEAMRDRVVAILTEEKEGFTTEQWQKFEAAEVTLDWVLEENGILDYVVRDVEEEYDGD